MSIPRQVLRAAELSVPVLVMFDLLSGRVFIKASDGSSTLRAVMVSKVGQVMVPRVAIDELDLGVDRCVYARVVDQEHAVELLSASRVSVEAVGAMS